MYALLPELILQAADKILLHNLLGIFLPTRNASGLFSLHALYLASMNKHTTVLWLCLQQQVGKHHRSANISGIEKGRIAAWLHYQDLYHANAFWLRARINIQEVDRNCLHSSLSNASV